MRQADPTGAGSPSRPKVVVYERVDHAAWSYNVERELLAARGVDLVQPADEAELPAAIRDADVVIATGRFLDSAAIGTLQRCVGLICYSIGMNQVDAEAARAAGITVTNCPFCVEEVADQAMTLLLAIERQLLPMVAEERAGDWSLTSPEFRSIRRLRGQTLAIIGAGRIGRQVARRARAFGFRTIANDPFVTPWEVGDPDLPLLPLADALGQADAVVLCASLNPTSRNLMNATTFAQLKPGALLVNIARGGLIDERALADAMRSGRVARAGLDVRATEPLDRANDPLAGLPNLVLTPHMAGGSIEANEDIHGIAASVAIRLLETAGRIVRV